MGSPFIVLARLLLGLGCAVVGLLALRWRWPMALPEKRFDRMFLWGFCVSRLAIFTLVFYVLRLGVHGDVVGYYEPTTIYRLRGALPYRDFISSFAPLFTYMYSVIYRLHPAATTLVLFAIVCECVAVAVWLRVARALFADTTVRLAALLYLCSALSVQFVTVDGQNNALISLLLAGACLLIVRGQSAASGAAAGVSIVLVKFLPLLWVPAMALSSRGWIRWAAGCLCVVLPVYGYFAWLLRGAMLMPLTREGSLRTAGNLPYLFESVTGRRPDNVTCDLVVLACMVALCVATVKWFWGSADGLRKQRTSMALMPLFLLVLMALSKVSWPNFLVMCLFPFLLAVVDEARGGSFWQWAIALLGVVSVTEQSFWAQMVRMTGARLVHLGAQRGFGLAIAQIGLEAALLLLYAYFISICVRAARRLASGTGPLPVDAV